MGAHNVIDDVLRAFLPFNPISPPYTSSYHFTSYLAHFPNIVRAFRYDIINDVVRTFFTHFQSSKTADLKGHIMQKSFRGENFERK